MTEVARDLLMYAHVKIPKILSPIEGDINMMCIDLEKRDQMAYRALFYCDSR